MLREFKALGVSNKRTASDSALLLSKMIIPYLGIALCTAASQPAS